MSVEAPPGSGAFTPRLMWMSTCEAGFLVTDKEADVPRGQVSNQRPQRQVLAEPGQGPTAPVSGVLKFQYHSPWWRIKTTDSKVPLWRG